MSKNRVTKNFTVAEIMCKCGCGNADIDLKFMLLVQDLRTAFGKPMVVNSGVRCAEHNKNVGGAENSYHVPTDKRKAMALDIKMTNDADRHRFLALASVSFQGIGVYDDFIHIDGRPGDGVCWV